MVNVTKIKYAILKDVVKLMWVDHDHTEHKLLIPIKEFENIAENLKQSRHKDDIKEYGSTDYGYTDICLGCNKWDYIVQGYCRPCFINKGLKYEDDRLN